MKKEEVHLPCHPLIHWLGREAYVSEADWRYVDVKTKSENVRQMKMVSKLEEREIKEYNDLVDKFSDTFAWSFEELRGISREMVEHRISLILGAMPIM
jgi:hypothetical protein